MIFNCKSLLSLGFVLSLFLIGTNLFSQKSNAIEVRDLNNDVLPFAWAGGLNAPQFSEIDLNNDIKTKNDLFGRFFWF